MYNESIMMTLDAANHTLVTEIQRVRKEYDDLLTKMKHRSRLKGTVVQEGSLEFKTDIGLPTPFFVDGVQLFTGDEVLLPAGEKAIVFYTETGDVKLKTSTYIYDLFGKGIMAQSRKSFEKFRNEVSPEGLVINLHFNTYENGDTVGEGFTVHINS